MLAGLVVVARGADEPLVEEHRRPAKAEPLVEYLEHLGGRMLAIQPVGRRVAYLLAITRLNVHVRRCKRPGRAWQA